VNPRRLFILKVFGFSLILFLLGRYLLHGYIAVLGIGTRITNLYYRLPPDIEKFLYGSSMTVIAFLSLTLATPKMSVPKKTGLIVGGMAAFFIVDLFFVQYVIFPFRRAPLNENYLLYEMYFCIKWLLPFLLWLTTSYPFLGELIDAQRKDERKA
jgi:hypothetical protein